MKKNFLITILVAIFFLFGAELAFSEVDTLWTKTYGGPNSDLGYSVQQTTDGGYIVTGYTDSYGLGIDLWLVKTNALGDTLWTKTYGGPNYDIGYSVQQTTDGGYIVTGYTNSYGLGYYDLWLVKTNASGDTLWTKTYGGPNSDLGYSVQQTTDGGYIVTGRTDLYGLGTDLWLIKTNASGDTLWTKTYGGPNSDYGYSVQQTTDGGYIVTGRADLYGLGGDLWLIKTNVSGDTLWTKTYGGPNSDIGYSVQQTTDGCYVVVGYTYGFDGTNGDLWLIKTNASGDTLWTKTYGGPSSDYGRSVQQTDDGGYIVVGYTFGLDGTDPDVWLLKIGEIFPEFEMKIQLASGNKNDRENFVGANNSLKDDYDPGIDIPEPPVPVSNYLQLYFPHPEWSMSFTNFSTDIRRAVDLFHHNIVWDFVVATDQINMLHTLNIVPVSGIDFTEHIYLKNVTTGELKRLTASDHNLCFTPTAAGNYPFQIIVGRLYPVQETSKTFSPGWNMLSLPLCPLDNTLDALFRDDTGNDGYFYQYQGSTGYRRCDSLQVGSGYWLGLLQSATLRFTGDSLNSTVTIPLGDKNNLIGNPFRYGIHKNNLSIIHDGVTKTFTEAVSAGWISAALHRWQNTGTGSYVVTDTLGIWDGAWLYALVDGLALQYNPGRITKSLTEGGDRLTGSNWEAQLRLSSTWGGDMAGIVGVNETATDEFDPQYDYPEPPTPPSGKFLTGYFEHNDWSALGPHYDRDIRSATTSSLVWNYTVKSALTGSVTISWEMVNLPSNYTLILHDPIQNRDVNFRSQTSYTFNYSSEITFTIRKDVAIGIDGGEVSLPKKFALSQNFPNPFNPITTIRYALSKSVRVQLSVYDLNGRVVEKLVDEQKSPGYYSVQWNAEHYGSGVYLYKLEAGDFIEIRKCVLVK
ncbi:MAG: T9SS type A sorting domain-containing protein [Candidatus Neomarinimicrobiota bacterium]